MFHGIGKPVRELSAIFSETRWAVDIFLEPYGIDDLNSL